MAVTYEWQIVTMEHEVSDGGVVVAHWKCSGSDTTGSGDDVVTYSAFNYGTCSFTYDASSSDFTPYDDLTESQVQGWVWGQVNQEDVESQIASNINEQINPATIDGVPW